MQEWSAQGVRYLKGVGPRVAEKLQKLGILTLRDLLFHLPLRYEDRTTVTPIGALQPGSRSLLQAQVLQAATSFRRQGRSRRVLVAKLEDASAVLTIRFFYFSKRQQAMLEKGHWLRCFGEVRIAQGELEMVHPEIEVIDIDDPPSLAQNLTPVYPTTEGLHQLSIGKIVRQAVESLQGNEMAETLPSCWLDAQGFPDFKSAMLHLHSPQQQRDTELIAQRAHPAQFRFIVEELTAHRLALLERRAKIRVLSSPAIKTDGSLIGTLNASLPFKLTGAQQRVVKTLLQDFDRGKPMIRLLQGDVGCGKTIVAALACLPVVESGFQCALMAPTEILAEQHFQSFSEWLSPLGLQLVNLMGADKGKKRQQKLSLIASGEAAIVIGTHALFQASVVFQSLGFIIIDEQHRFGVDQRLALQKKITRHEMPHQLIMTATPIPRTLAMSIYADLDYSQIDELPPGRKPVTTSVILEHKRANLIESVARACAGGGQVYWVCTLIEESEALQYEAAERTFESLQQAMPQLSIGLVHGRMKTAQKEAVVRAFKQGDIDVLVATTVIEVGVDVPNASIMIIENPERLGLSQIHQLRGRVGRGVRESFCILLIKNNLPTQATQRLEIIRNHQDGFVIAQKDLEMRGAGEVLGTRQTGETSFKIADLLRDQCWFNAVNDLTRLMQQAQYSGKRDELMQNWIGDKQGYTDVG
ncbi:MAG: ATP-dependent DNA helicase RecG [Gammaproteobacteria bacterium]|nr:ATP-dependent DNA helicase RecG [Gammaproteobacteria bacterium]